MVAPAMFFTVNEVRAAIRVLNPKKAPGYNLITNQVLQKLSEKGIRFITQLCNAVLRQGFFSPQWKVAQIIMIQKPGKPAELESYRPISLLPVEIIRKTFTVKDFRNNGKAKNNSQSLVWIPT